MLRRSTFLSLSAFVVLFGIFFAYTSFAQFDGTEPLTISISPEYPKPHQTVTVSPDSNLIDLSSSEVTVFVNGVLVNKTTGMEDTFVRVGGAGETTTITVSALNNGATYTTKIVVRPADVALVIEPLSTVHPFYRGGSLIASGGRVRLIALPEFRTGSGALIPAKDLVYTWKNGDQILQEYSGIGKSVLNAVSPPRYRDARITLTVTTIDSSVVAQSVTTVGPSDPIVHIYRNDPLLGPLFGNALLKTFAMSADEETFRAVPYFFSDRPNLSWLMNGTPSESAEDITVRASGGVGTALLGIQARTTDGAQNGNTSVSIQFGKSVSRGIFGL
jgi:hypothetical protein